MKNLGRGTSSIGIPVHHGLEGTSIDGQAYSAAVV